VKPGGLHLSLEESLFAEAERLDELITNEILSKSEEAEPERATAKS